MKTENIKMAIISFLILFLELTLIKLIGTEIRIFAYVPNLILLAAFIGSGFGVLIKRKMPLYYSSMALILIIAALNLAVFKNITNLLSPISDSFIWFQGTSANFGNIVLGFLLTLTLFILVLFIFVPLGQLLGDIFNNSQNLIKSYSINIVFSLMGTLAFNYFTYLSLSPYLFILLSMVLIATITVKKRIIFSTAALFVVTPFLLISIFGSKNVIWSPYQKLELRELPGNPLLPPGKMLNVNNVGYMGLLDLSKEYQNNLQGKLIGLGVNPDTLNNLKYRNQYDLPYYLNPDAEDALLIGAGAGNDAAGALRMDIKEIVAVEIDPKIIEMGKKHHPENPYSNEKVKLISQDGRAYLQKTNKKFDVVVMGLTDSHTLNSSLTNIQLDNFLYTKQSMEQIYEVLKDDGLLFLSFDVRRNWIGSRIKGSIKHAFGQEPLIINMQNDQPIFGWGGVFFVASKNPKSLEKVLNEDEQLNQFIQSRKIDYSSPQKQLTDNWPYLYLKAPKIPNIHLITSALLLIVFSLSFKLLKIKQSFKLIPFFFGAAFLLYEFQNISRASLLYGNTWTTNVFIISTILLMILAANLLSLKVQLNKKILYVLLIASFLFEYAIPVASFTHYPNILKYTVIPLLLNLPLFFSALLFIQYFQETKDRRSFYAYNLFGSAVGGLSSYLSYMFGIKFLMILSVLFYLITTKDLILKKE